jgi:hypothetical protein
MEDIGAVRNAGGVWFLRVDATGSLLPSQGWSQDSPGVNGVAEGGDHFGSALGARGGYVVVGVPGENIDGAVDAGMVQVLERSSSGSFVPRAGISQNRGDVPGAAERADQFGASVAVGVALLTAEGIDVAVGTPGETVGTRTETGAVTLVCLSDRTPNLRTRVLRQGSGLAGAAEPFDRVGLVLGLTRGRTDLDEDYADRLLLGVPDEDIGAVADAGGVLPADGGIYVDRTLVAGLKFSRGYLRSWRYGMVLSSPSD